jgi:transposase
MYVEIIKKKQGAKVYRTALIRESYKKDGSVKHRTISNISQLTDSQIAQIKAILSGQGRFLRDDELETCASWEYGASAAFLELGKRLGLDQLLYSRREPWRDDLMALITGRIVHQGSKLRLSNLHLDSALWELCGHSLGEKVDVRRHCYEPMDRLLARQKFIQKKLAERHLTDGCLVLYDITNTWFEGEYDNSRIVDFGRGKGGKKGYRQIAIGLIANKRGCPVAIEVFNGRTSDQMTVKEQAERLARDYGVEQIVFAGDRGMLTPKRIEEVNEQGFRTLTALTHPQVRKLLENNVIHPELFDERGVAEVIDPDNPAVRYMLCKNPYTMRKESATRQSLIQATSEKLKEIAKIKRKRDQKKVCARIGVLLAKYKVGKFFEWTVDKNGRLEWAVNNELVEKEKALDGCYIVRTDVHAEKMDKDEVVRSYKALTGVEKAFRNLKTVSLEIRPVYHKKDDRIRAHVFLCMLAYYIQWHAIEYLQPLFENNGEKSDRRWSWHIVLERLKSIRKTEIKIKGVRMAAKISVPDAEQQEILDLLGVKIR